MRVLPRTKERGRTFATSSKQRMRSSARNMFFLKLREDLARTVDDGL